MPVSNEELVQAILAEQRRIWGGLGPYDHYLLDDGLHDAPHFGGTPEEYAWLQAHYGITEEKDVRWQFVLESYAGLLSLTEEDAAQDPNDREMRQFVRDPAAVRRFLETLLAKYRSNTAQYPR